MFSPFEYSSLTTAILLPLNLRWEVPGKSGALPHTHINGSHRHTSPLNPNWTEEPLSIKILGRFYQLIRDGTQSITNIDLPPLYLRCVTHGSKGMLMSSYKKSGC